MPATASATERASPSPGEWMDVWSRSGSKYRIRAVVLALANTFLFACVGMFAFWLRSGELLALTREGYGELLLRTFRGVGRAEVSLGAMLIEPISVQDVPMQIPIVGLLMAALISIPILVAILYRFWSCLPLIAVVGFLAVMPWLALTLLGSCVLASVRPLRTRFRFTSALIGLVPAAAYLTLAWSGTTEALVGKIDPVDRVRFVAPWVLAMVASTVVFAVVLAIAKIVDYRPGAVTPLLTVMFLLPVLLFEFHVGRDELQYRLLEKLDQTYFADADASQEWENAALHAWETHPLPRPSWESVRKAAQDKWLFESTDPRPLESDLARNQVWLAERCDRFYWMFPDSRYTPNGLYLKARALDRRIDPAELRQQRWIRYYDDFPSVASRETWRLILENRADTLLGAAAGLRLAQLEAREGDVDRAIEKLRNLVSRFDTTAFQVPPPARAGVFESVLEREPPEGSLRVPLERIVMDGRRLLDLLTRNRDPNFAYDPLCGSRRRGDAFRVGLLDLDPRHEAYVTNLEALRTQYPGSVIDDNIELELAKAAATTLERIAGLESLIARYPDADAAEEGLLRLAAAYQETGAGVQRDNALARLRSKDPPSVWARFSERLPMASAARSHP